MGRGESTPMGRGESAGSCKMVEGVSGAPGGAAVNQEAPLPRHLRSPSLPCVCACLYFGSVCC